MAFCRLLLPNPEIDPRLWDDHTKLDMRWSDEQVEPILDRLGLSSSREHQAIGQMVRSLVVDAKTDNRGVHFSRAQEWYANRYVGNGDPYHTYHYTPRAADWVEENGYADQIKGRRFTGRESVLYPFPKLLDKIGDLIDPFEPRGRAPRPEAVILRGPDGKNVPYVDTDETIAVSQQLWAFNDDFAAREFRHQGQRDEIPLLRRIFNEDFSRGGRLYAHGSSFQGRPGPQRLEMTEIIDGVAHQMVEIDYPTWHYSLAYAEAGKRMPSGDLYEIDGFDRRLVKTVGLIALNAKNKKNAIGALIHETGATYGEAKRVLKAVRRRHHRIKDYFWSDSGARLMRKDSDIAVEVMTRVMARTGRAPLPVHDSFLVPDIDAEVLAHVMTEVAAEHGVGGAPLTLRPPVSDEEEETPTPPTIPSMEVYPADLGKEDCPTTEPVALKTASDLPAGPIEGQAPPPDPPPGAAVDKKHPKSDPLLVEAVLAVVRSWREASAAEQLRKQQRRRAGAKKAAQTRAETRRQRREFLECQP